MWIDRNDCDRKNWSRVRIPKTWIQFFLANLANYESLKRGAKDRNPLANNNFHNSSKLPGIRQNTLAEYTSGYIVGTYIISV
jgi:hypothetical protein